MDKEARAHGHWLGTQVWTSLPGPPHPFVVPPRKTSGQAQPPLTLRRQSRLGLAPYTHSRKGVLREIFSPSNQRSGVSVQTSRQLPAASYLPVLLRFCKTRVFT